MANINSLRYNQVAILTTFKHSLLSYQVATEPEHPKRASVSADLLEIIKSQVENSTVTIIARIQNYHKLLEKTPDPSVEELQAVFFVPFSSSRGFLRDVLQYQVS